MQIKINSCEDLIRVLPGIVWRAKNIGIDISTGELMELQEISQDCSDKILQRAIEIIEKIPSNINMKEVRSS